jgi:hypothetical protein
MKQEEQNHAIDHQLEDTTMFVNPVPSYALSIMRGTMRGEYDGDVSRDVLIQR